LEKAYNLSVQQFGLDSLVWKLSAGSSFKDLPNIPRR
jgi:hypothetical protein